MVGLGCLTLTVVSYALSHSVEVDTALVRCLVSLAAIGITTALAMRHKLATIALRGQAELLDLTHDAIFVRDMNDVITYWNRGAEELYGWSKAEAIRQVTHNLTQTIFPEPLEDITAELLRAGRWEGELIHRKRDGSRVTVDSRWALQRDAGGQPRAVLETNTDITKRKRAEEKVLQQEQALQLAIDTIQTLVWRADASGAAEFFNQRWLEYTGLTFESARGWAWGSVIHPDDFPHLTAEWRKILASGKYGEAEGRLRRFDGEYRCFLFRAETLRDEAGNVISWYGVNIDIEDMKLAQRRSLQAERELRLAIDTIPGMVWSSSANGSVEFVNKRWSEMGLTLEDIRGARWKGLIHPHDLPQMESDWDHAVRTCGPFENVSRVRRADGQYRWLLIRAAALLDETGNPLKWYGIDSDIEDQKRAEEALRRSEAYSLEAQRLSLTGSFGRKTATNELFWSEEMYRIFGYELGVKPTTELALRRVHPDDTALYRGAIESMARGEPDVEVQVRLLMPDGAIKHIRVLAHGTATEEGHAEYVGAVMDVTTAKKAEEALQEPRWRYPMLSLCRWRKLQMRPRPRGRNGIPDFAASEAADTVSDATGQVGLASWPRTAQAAIPAI